MEFQTHGVKIFITDKVELLCVIVCGGPLMCECGVF